jgi:hypothetical protein
MPRKPFAVPAPIVSTPLATAVELRAAVESQARQGIRATMEATERLLVTWFDEHPDEDTELVTEWTALRDRCARILASPQPEPEPIPATVLELATTYADRWIVADKDEREVLREEAGSFSDEMKQAVNAAVKSRREPVG